MGNVFSAFRYLTENRNDAPDAEVLATTNATSATMPGPSTTLPSTNQKYDVFISHAGEDKATIAMPLREKLRERGISAFVDEADMPPGTITQPAMIDAMETAKVAVIVLSPEFVAREWPMKELMYFLRRVEECAADDRAAPVVIPCLYRLQISELYGEPLFHRRDKDGKLLYHESRFSERQKRGEPEANVAAIKAALKKVHGIMGVRNDWDASNESSLLMSKRREKLLEELCHRVEQAVPAWAMNMRSADHDSNDRQNQAPIDRFRKFYPRLSSGVRAVLDFDNQDEDGNPMTPEGLVKQHLLEETSDSPRIVSIHGIGGVGKSTILRALSVDKQIRERFPDGVHIVKLGKDASTATLLRQLCQVLKDSGAEKTYQSLSIQNDMDAVLHFLESWFDGKICAILVDDVWEHGIGLGSLSRLPDICSAPGSAVLITTREHEIASLAPLKRIIRLGPREPSGIDARRMLFFHAEHEETDNLSASVDVSINTILKICGGLPVNLAAAGKNVRKLSIDMPRGEGVWKEYLSELVECRDRLLRENVERYGNLYATFATSISILDKQPREEILGFASALSFAEMHRRLCVLQKQAAVPKSMLKHLWQTKTDERANMIARTFVESGLASREAVRVGEEYLWYVSLHDSVHDFAVAEAKRHRDTKEAHDCLLNGYKSCDPDIPCEVRGTSRWWSRQLEPDRYIHRNLSRHLIGAGRAAELVGLLLSPEWVERQLEVNDILFLQADFSLGITALQDGMIDASDQECCEIEEALQLILRAVALSSRYTASNKAELWFQLHGRLKGSGEKCRAIGEYIARIEREAARPLILCKSNFLRQPGGANTKIISIDAAVNCMVMMKDGELVACGCSDGRCFIVNVKRSVVEKQWKAHEGRVYAIAVGKGGTRLVSGSSDRSAKVWKVETGRCVATFMNHSGWVNDVAVIGDGRRVVSVSSDCTAKIWNIETGQILSKPFTGHEDYIKCVAMLGDGEEELAVTGGIDRKLRVWNVTTSAQVGGTFDGHEDLVRCVVVTPDGKCVVSGSDDKTVRVWDVGSHQQIGNSLKGHTRYVYCLAVSGDGRRLVSGSSDNTMRVWDLESGTEICDPLEGHTDRVTGVSFLSDVDAIVSCSFDGTVRVWDMTRKNNEQLTSRHHRAVSSVSFTPDGKFVVSGSCDGTLRVWNATSGHQVGDPLKGHSDRVNDVAVTPDGRRVVSVSDDAILHVWDLESRELQHTLTGHTEWISCVAVTPQGDYAVTGSYDKTVRVWNLTAICDSHVVLEGHSDFVHSVFVTDDGLRIVSVDKWDSIFVWELETKKLVKKFGKEGARKLSRREVLNVVGESTVYDDTTLSIPLLGHKIICGEGTNPTILATMETEVHSWALSPDKKTICVGFFNGQVGFLKLET